MPQRTPGTYLEVKMNHQSKSKRDLIKTSSLQKLDSRRVLVGAVGTRHPRCRDPIAKTHLESRCCAGLIYKSSFICTLHRCPCVLLGVPDREKACAAIGNETNGMGYTLLYAGFETCFGWVRDVFWLGPPAPKVLGSGSICKKHIPNPDVACKPF